MSAFRSHLRRKSAAGHATVQLWVVVVVSRQRIPARQSYAAETALCRHWSMRRSVVSVRPRRNVAGRTRRGDQRRLVPAWVRFVWRVQLGGGHHGVVNADMWYSPLVLWCTIYWPLNWSVAVLGCPAAVCCCRWDQYITTRQAIWTAWAVRLMLTSPPQTGNYSSCSARLANCWRSFTSNVVARRLKMRDIKLQDTKMREWLSMESRE